MLITKSIQEFSMYQGYSRILVDDGRMAVVVWGIPLDSIYCTTGEGIVITHTDTSLFPLVPLASIPILSMYNTPIVHSLPRVQRITEQARGVVILPEFIPVSLPHSISTFWVYGYGNVTGREFLQSNGAPILSYKERFYIPTLSRDNCLNKDVIVTGLIQRYKTADAGIPTIADFNPTYALYDSFYTITSSLPTTISIIVSRQRAFPLFSSDHPLYDILCERALAVAQVIGMDFGCVHFENDCFVVATLPAPKGMVWRNAVLWLFGIPVPDIDPNNPLQIPI